jgi:hypothetical protein
VKPVEGRIVVAGTGEEQGAVMQRLGEMDIANGPRFFRSA